MTPPKRPHKTSHRPPDMEETKEHVLAAGREILLAAQGALRFCKTYVEATSESTSKPHLISFFQKAINVADDLGKSILNVSPIKTAAKSITKSVLEAMEEEMTAEEKPSLKKKRKRTRGTKIRSTKSENRNKSK